MPAGLGFELRIRIEFTPMAVNFSVYIFKKLYEKFSNHAYLLSCPVGKSIPVHTCQHQYY